MKEIRIVVADDSLLIREQLARAFATLDGCALVGMATDGEEAIRMIRALRPDIALLDISMPHRSGIEVLKQIRSELPNTQIMMFTADPSVVLKQACLEAGADYYLDKSQLTEMLTICEQMLKEDESC